jgi:L-rhamnose mutarotase
VTEPTPSTSGLRKVCFLLRVKPELLAEYRERHAAVWPEMLDELERSGRHNYSLFLRPDGLLVGYFETDADDDGDGYLAASPIAERWEREMAPFFFDDGSRPDQNIERLEQVFDLERQQAQARR